jgi:hypothetical protein
MNESYEVTIIHQPRRDADGRLEHRTSVRGPYDYVRALELAKRLHREERTVTLWLLTGAEGGEAVWQNGAFVDGERLFEHPPRRCRPSGLAERHVLAAAV